MLSTQKYQILEKPQLAGAIQGYKRNYKGDLVTAQYIQRKLDACKTSAVTVGRFDYEKQEMDYHTAFNSCLNRCCPKCEGTRRGRSARKYKNVLLHFNRVSVLTLTYKGRHKLNSKTKRKLELQARNFMKRLQRRTNYKIQYIRVLEIVKKPSGFYYHYHYLIDMPYVSQKVISKYWDAVTDGSFIVWIEILKTENGTPIGAKWKRLPDKQKQQNAVKYLVKYVAKPVPNMNLDAYARYVYRTHFVETKTNLTCINGRKSSTRYRFISATPPEEFKNLRNNFNLDPT